MALHLSKEALRAALAKLRSFMSEGLEHDEIALALGVSLTEYHELLKRFYEEESDVVRNKTTEEVYVDYVIQQNRNIRDLTNILSEFDDAKQPAAAVGAIRARSDILDKIIAKGQEFGFIEKKPERKLVAGVLITNLSTPELRKKIAGELGTLERLMEQYGDAPSIGEIDPGPLHRPAVREKMLPASTPEPLTIDVESSPSKELKTVKPRRRSAVHRGRRVVKPKKNA